MWRTAKLEGASEIIRPFLKQNSDGTNAGNPPNWTADDLAYNERLSEYADSIQWGVEYQPATELQRILATGEWRTRPRVEANGPAAPTAGMTRDTSELLRQRSDGLAFNFR